VEVSKKLLEDVSASLSKNEVNFRHVWFSLDSMWKLFVAHEDKDQGENTIHDE